MPHVTTPPTVHPVLAEVTDRITERSSAPERAAYLAPDPRGRASADPPRGRLACANLAHGFAASGTADKDGAARHGQAEHRDRVGLQRHALGAPAVRDAIPPSSSRRCVAAGGDRAVRRRRARHVRRRHPGPRRHGAVAVQPRRDRDGDRDRAVARHVRRRADARRLRQDRARPADRRAGLRPPADGLRAGRPDDLGPAQRREGAGPPALRRGQGRPRRAARRRGRVVPRPRHLHLLRHRQLQPDADGGDGPAPAGRELRQPGHAAARRRSPPRPAAGSPG